jgi:hypothetical protein
MIRIEIVSCIFIALLLTGCSVLKNSPKYGFNEGYYKSRIFHKKLKHIYVVPGEDSIKVYTAKRLRKEILDTSKLVKIAFPQNQKPSEFENYIFRKNSFDIDLLTIAFKYQPSVNGFPRQLNAIAYEYDGAVNLLGINAVLGVEKLSLGLAVGTDHLLDKNRKHWVNQSKPWVGISFGLNLN